MNNGGMNIDRPDYYQNGEFECIDIIESLGYIEGFCIGNILKYLWRYGRKDDDYVVDLRKAEWYLSRLINKLDKRADSK